MKRVLMLLAIILCSCHGSPTEPRMLALTDGKWSGDGACLVVLNANVYPHTSTLTAGCGRGQFPTPDLRQDGTFDVDGTFGIQAGPTTTNPLPPAHYSGSLTSTTLTLTVKPQSGATMTYHLRIDPNANCNPPCV